MTSWQTKTIGELVDYEQPSKYLVKDTNYIEDGAPVLTANKAFVLGYTHETEGIYVASKDSPVIIFDDFTTDNKFVDFDFKVKSSAIKILTAKHGKALPRFVHGAMQLIKTEITEHKRRFISEYQFHPIDTPEIVEQQRIVGVLEVWDEYIEKLEQKIALKEQLKKGLMQQLLTGKRRLPGFKKDWQAVKLGNISRIKTGGKDNQNKIADGMYPFFVRSPQIERINSYCFDGEAILVPGEGNIGKIFHYINGKFDYHQRVYGITHFADNVSGRYIYYFFVKNFARQAEKHSVKATVDSLRLPTFSNFIINLPSLDEQVAIVKVLDGLAEEVRLSEKKLKKINDQKKYLLKNLITGTIRTPDDLQPLDSSRLERSAL